MGKKSSSTNTGFVTVACKLPQGLIVTIPGAPDVSLNGRYSPFAIGEHGMTQVREDTWEQIQELYAGAKWLTGEHVFALGDPASAKDKAEDRAEINAGFDPIDPEAPEKTPGINPSIGPIDRQ